MHNRVLKFLILLFTGTALAAPALAQQRDFRAEGQSMTAAFYARHTALLWQRMAEPMRAALKSPEALAGFREQVGTQLGSETAVLDESIHLHGPIAQYKRMASFSGTPSPVEVMWAFSADGQIAGFSVQPRPALAASAHAVYATRTKLRLPFDTPFMVVWGGRELARNHHAAHPNQRFALDLLAVRDGVTHQGKGTTNQDYYCFGQTLVAPAAGRIVSATDGIPDNVPGQRDPAQLLGNHVVIDHGNSEFSLLAHLRQGSVRVKAGTQISAGAMLGQCGNSGNSSEAHLHYQLQNGAEFGKAESVPVQFTDYLADGTPVARGEPQRGQLIAPAPETHTAGPAGVRSDIGTRARR